MQQRTDRVVNSRFARACRSADDGMVSRRHATEADGDAAAADRRTADQPVRVGRRRTRRPLRTVRSLRGPRRPGAAGGDGPRSRLRRRGHHHLRRRGHHHLRRRRATAAARPYPVDAGPSAGALRPARRTAAGHSSSGRGRRRLRRSHRRLDHLRRRRRGRLRLRPRRPSLPRHHSLPRLLSGRQSDAAAAPAAAVTPPYRTRRRRPKSRRRGGPAGLVHRRRRAERRVLTVCSSPAVSVSSPVVIARQTDPVAFCRTSS